MHRRVRPAVAFLALAAMLVGGCAGETGLPTNPGSTSVPADSGPLSSWLPSDEPGGPGDSGSPDGEETAEPGEETPTPTGQETLPPDEETPPPGDETPSPGEETPAPTGEPLESPSPTAGAAACTGSVDNRTFFEHIAGQVDWDLYCAVLPERWFVEAGQFSLRDGGRMEVTYKGPEGARLTLQEGNYCTDGVSACSPRDHTLGDAMFGDLAGGLVTLGPDDGFAIYVDPGQSPSWAATGTGLDQDTFVALAEALYRVEP